MSTPEHARSHTREAKAATAPVVARSVDRTSVREALSGSRVQRKVQVGPVDDAYEQEADRVADRVMRDVDEPVPEEEREEEPPEQVRRLPAEAPVQRQADEPAPVSEQELAQEHQPETTAEQVDTSAPVAGGAVSSPGESGGPATPEGGAEEGAVPDEELLSEDDIFEMAEAQELTETVQRAPAASAVRPRVTDEELDALRRPSGGRPLPLAVQRRAERALGAGLDHVRVHDGPEAADLAVRMSARAFTLGSHVWLGPGQRADDTRLMTHELTHVVQQGAAKRPPARGPPAGPPPEAGPARPRAPPGLVQRDFRDWVPDRILNGLANIADRVPGWRLLAFVVGSEPITGRNVSRNGQTLLHAVEPILPASVVQSLRESGVVDRAFAWFRDAVARLNLTWSTVVGLIERAWDAVSIRRGLRTNWERIKAVFAPTLQRIWNFVKEAATKFLEFAFEAFLVATGPLGQRVFSFFARVRNVIGLVVSNPGRFLGNLVSAVGGGMRRFFSRIWTHLQTGFVAWLTGTLSQAGIQMPARWNLSGVISLGLQILGLTWQNVRRRLVRALNPNGERKVSIVERGIDLIQRVLNQGVTSIVPYMLDQLPNILDKVVEGISTYVITRVGMEAASYLSGLFTGGLGTLIKVAQKIYQLVVWVINNLQRLEAIVTTVANSIEAIALGRIQPAARAVEATMASFVPLLIGLFATLLGLGDLPQRIRDIVRRLTAPVNRAIDFVIRLVVRAGRRIFDRAKALARRAVSWFRRRATVGAGRARHTLYFGGSPKAARLMIRSTPTEIGRWFDQQVAAITAGSPAAGLVAEAKAKRTEVETAITAARNDPNAGERVAARFEALKTAIDALLAHLVAPDEMPLTDLSNAFPETHSIPVGTTQVVVGKRMRVAPLTAAGPRGSEVRNDTPLWQALRRRPQGGRTYWIQAHFLNNNLHGPGNRPENLTPLFQNSNAQHETQVESKVKDAVLTAAPGGGGGGGGAAGAGGSRPPIVGYEVEAVYPGSPRSMPATQGLSPEVVETLEAERYLAERFLCRAWYLEKDEAGKWTREGPSLLGGSIPIDNVVPMTPFAPGGGTGGGGGAPLALDSASPADLAGLTSLARYAGDANRLAAIAAAGGQGRWDAFERKVAEQFVARGIADTAVAGSEAADIRGQLERDRRVVLFRRR